MKPYLSIVFYSPNGQPRGPRARIYNFAKRLASFGHSVTIYTKSHYHGTSSNYLPFYLLWKTEYIDGIRVVWINTPIYLSNSYRRLFSEIVFSFLSFLHFLVIHPKVSILIADSVSPINSAMGLLASKLKRSLFVHQVRDVWPISLVYDGSLSANSLTYKFFRLLEKLSYKHADWIISALPFVIDHIQASGGNPHNISYIRNGVDLTPYVGSSQYDGGSSVLVVTYVGTIAHAHDVVTLVRAAKIVSDKMPGRFFLNIW